MKDPRKYTKIFVWAFLLLYLLVAAISFCHAIEFFNIGNVQWMSVTLAFAFELGLAVCLASILLGTNKDNMVAWILLVVLVIVQVCGNTYSVFKYISLSGTDYYQYLAKPLLFFIEEVSKETVQIIIAWIMGAILPIVALLMTEMVSKHIKEVDSYHENDIESQKVTVVNDPVNMEHVITEGSEDTHDDIFDDHLINDNTDVVRENTISVPEIEDKAENKESGVIETIKKVLTQKKEEAESPARPQKIKFTQTGPMVQQPKPDLAHYGERNKK